MSREEVFEALKATSDSLKIFYGCEKNLHKLRSKILRADDFLGSGSFGTVYALDEKMVVKVGEVSFSEIEALKRLNYSRVAPRILACEVYQERGDLDNCNGWVIMERVQGSPLYNYDYLQQLSVVENYWTSRAKMHLHGVAHLDLHSGNFLVQKDNSVKVLDFGLSRVNWVSAFFEAVAGCSRNEHSSCLIDSNIPSVFLDGESKIRRAINKNLKSVAKSSSFSKTTESDRILECWKELAGEMNEAISTAQQFVSHLDECWSTDNVCVPSEEEAMELVRRLYTVVP